MGKLAKSDVRDRGSDDPDAGTLLPTRFNFGTLGFNLLLLDRFPPLPDYLLLGPVYQLLVSFKIVTLYSMAMQWPVKDLH